MSPRLNAAVLAAVSANANADTLMKRAAPAILVPVSLVIFRSPQGFALRMFTYKPLHADDTPIFPQREAGIFYLCPKRSSSRPPRTPRFGRATPGRSW